MEREATPGGASEDHVASDGHTAWGSPLARMAQPLSALFDVNSTRRMAGSPPLTSSQAELQSRTNMQAAHQVQRRNLLQMTQLAVKQLIETGVQKRHQLDETHVPLEQFCVMLEHALRHGLKAKKGLFGTSKVGTALWEFICTGLAHLELARQSLDTLRCIPTLQSDVARCRAWIRLSLMEKSLADYFSVLSEDKTNTVEWYHDWALMRCEEGNVIAGLLVGLSAIDANIDLKSSNMEGAGVIDFSQYLKDSNHQRDLLFAPANVAEDSAEGDSPLHIAEREAQEIAILLDQKHYAESLVTKLREELETAQGKIKALTAELAGLSKLHAENNRLSRELQQLRGSYMGKIQELETAMEDERQTFKTSMHEMEKIYQAIRKQFETEMLLRLEGEREHAAVKAMLAAREADLQNMQARTESQGIIGTTILCPSPSVLSGEEGTQPKERLGQGQSVLSTSITPTTAICGHHSSPAKGEGCPLALQTNDKASYPKGANNTSSDTKGANEISPDTKGANDTSPQTKSTNGTLPRQPMLSVSPDMHEHEECHECHQSFSLTRRKIKCRSCRTVVCTDCAMQKAALPGTGRPVPMCNSCYSATTNQP